MCTQQYKSEKQQLLNEMVFEIPGSRSFERYVLHAGLLDDSDNLVDTDISSEPAIVQSICNAVWTADVKAAWKSKLIADKPSS